MAYKSHKSLPFQTSSLPESTDILPPFPTLPKTAHISFAPLATRLFGDQLKPQCRPVITFSHKDKWGSLLSPAPIKLEVLLDHPYRPQRKLISLFSNFSSPALRLADKSFFCCPQALLCSLIVLSSGV